MRDYSHLRLIVNRGGLTPTTVVSTVARMKRREFLQAAAATTSALWFAGCSAKGGGQSTMPRARAVAFSDPRLKELADMALSAAREAGASYADIRIADYARQTIQTREKRVISINDGQDRGFGVRVIAKGTWGFAASSVTTAGEVVRVAQKAVAIALAARRTSA